MESLLFTPWQLGKLHIRNRIIMAPMCQYSAQEGHVQPWHLVHYGSRAAGGAGLVILEATAVEARGRISPDDLGIWDDSHIAGLASLADSIRELGAVPGIQLAHAGRKASTSVPFRGFGPLNPDNGGWPVIGPSALPYSQTHQTPKAMTLDDIQEVQTSFILAARRAVDAGFSLIELHAAHGYLLHSFYSPISNRRQDEYGGDIAGRSRFLLELAAELRAVLPRECELAVRISASDWLDNGWQADDSIWLSGQLKETGVSLIDVSSGGISPESGHPEPFPGYQVPLASRIRKEAGIASAAVGLLQDPVQIEEILRKGDADAVSLGRELLRNPYWPSLASQKLTGQPYTPLQYARAWK